MSKLFLAVLTFTFSSGFGGIGYRQFASRMLWPVGLSWGKRTLDFLCFAAMLVALVEAWGAYGLLTACAVALVGAMLAFVLTLLIKQHIQVLNLIGITIGSILSLLGPSAFG
ncbi:MAG: hypothetical protein LAN63_03435 [Acidobacteriia bacterium]|nr:hypothetical protein [Terriglobia bacterium]